MSTQVLSALDRNFVALANTMGHAVLVETLKLAAYYLNHSNGLSFSSRTWQGQLKEARSCYVFMQGTGLEAVINKFDMMYNAETIRDVFNYCVRHSE